MATTASAAAPPSTGQPTPGASERVPGRAAKRRDMTAGLLFVLPMLVLFLMFRAFPTLGAIGLSFTNYQLSGKFDVVGAKNYVDFFTTEVARNALGTTLLYALIYVPLMLIVALGIAVLLNQIVWGSGVFRSAMFLPYVTSFVLAGIIWTWLLALDGPLNALVTAVGQAPIPFLSGSQPLILTSIASASVWHGYGYSMLILLAGLTSRPLDVVEAARIDGASSWQIFTHMTLPHLRQYIELAGLLGAIYVVQNFDHVFTITSGGLGTANLPYFIYQTFYTAQDYGRASAAGVVVVIGTIIIATAALRTAFSLFKEES